MGGDRAGGEAKQGKRVAGSAPNHVAWKRAGFCKVAGWFLLCYFAVIMRFRYHLRGWGGLYDAIWGCNAALVMAGVGMITLNRNLIAAAVNVVSFPHYMWLVDVITWLGFGFFPVGNAEYLVWAETSYMELYTTMHHVWFMPLCIFTLYGNGGMPWISIVYGQLATAILGVLALAAPKHLTLPSGEQYYLNVNMAHEFWKDVKMDWYHLADGKGLFVYQLWLNFCSMYTCGPSQAATVGLSQWLESRRTAARSKKE